MAASVNAVHRWLERVLTVHLGQQGGGEIVGGPGVERRRRD
jgi:hypothetical protein